MQYKFTPERENYELYASGGVLYAVPGHPAFPVRLASEIFRRCMAHRQAQGMSGRCLLYDPCCGGAYHLTTIAYFNGAHIDQIIGSDIDDRAVSFAGRNLGLLTLDGLEQRITELEALHAQFGKESHALALRNAGVLQAQLRTLLQAHALRACVFRADATDAQQMAAGLNGAQPDVVISDIPYGLHSNWRADTRALAEAADPVVRLLDALLPLLAPHAVVAIAAPKTGKIRHERYRRLERFQLGKRQIVILQPAAA